MIQIDNKLVSDDLFEKRFVCNLSACKGACCVEGESGAPLEPSEVGKMEEILEDVIPFMRPAGIARVEEVGVFTVDLDGDYVTPLINDAECAFVQFDEAGIAKCAIELAYRAGKTDFPKPISCHLYPIRLAEIGDYTALNYHHWPICSPALECGGQLDIPVYRFLKGPIVRRFGEEFFEALNIAAEELGNNPLK